MVAGAEGGADVQGRLQQLIFLPRVPGDRHVSSRAVKFLFLYERYS